MPTDPPASADDASPHGGGAPTNEGQAQLDRVAEKLEEIRQQFSSLEGEVQQLSLFVRRTAADRAREFKYRFAQSAVFGLPVIALQLFGPVLGPADWPRWVSLLQALLAGWVVYVNLGMLFEGFVLLWWREWTWSLPVVLIAIGAYLYSAGGAMVAITTTQLPYRLLFDGCVTLLAVWTGWRWMRLARLIRRAAAVSVPALSHTSATA
jgi:cation transport ATPase